MTLAFDIEPGPTGVLVRLKGGFDERSSPVLAALAKKLPASPAALTFHCRQVDQINSAGVREWAQFLRGLKKRPVTFIECSVFFVDYANLIADLLGHGSIASFLVPASCTACHAEEQRLYTVEQARNPGFFDAATCRKCGASLEADVSLTDYLGFLDEA